MKIQILLIVLLLCGCTNNNEPIVFVDTNQNSPAFEPAPVYIENQITKGTPLIGFTTNSNSYSIAEIEETITNHNIYAFDYIGRDAVPFEHILQAYILDKIPLITIAPTNETVLELAQDIGLLQIPVIVNLVPLDVSTQSTLSDYISQWQYYSLVFKNIAPNAKLLWTTSGEDIFTEMQFYPGDKYTDYVGIQAFEKQEEIKLFNTLDHLTSLLEKPIIVTLSVSHFSTQDHKYKINEATEKIAQIYSTLTKDYPQVMAVIYNNIDFSQSSPSTAICNDYRISTDINLLEAYKKSAKEYSSTPFSKYIKSNFNGIIANNNGYIHKNTLIYELKDTSNIDENSYFNNNYLQPFNYNITLSNNNIYLKKST